MTKKIKFAFYQSFKTLKSNIELSNIDLKVEFKKSHRELDLKGLTLNGQIMLVLSQNKNDTFTFEFYIDKSADLAIQFKKDQVYIQFFFAD